MIEYDKALLRQSLPLAREWAANMCRHVDDSGVCCEPFHGIWQILRYLGLNTTAAEHGDFYVNALSREIRNGARRVLISGTADYAMLEVVQHAFFTVDAPAEITILDVCSTPLRLCQWYADMTGSSVRSCCSDILTYREANSYDVICTHSFLGLFDWQHRARLTSVWHDLLVQGGSVISVNRVRPGAGKEVGFTSGEADAFVAKVTQAMKESDLSGVISEKEIADLARRYIQHRIIHPIRSEEEISSMFHAAGFHTEQMSTVPLAGEMNAPSGPTLRGGARYACFVMRNG